MLRYVIVKKYIYVGWDVYKKTLKPLKCVKVNKSSGAYCVHNLNKICLLLR